MEDCRGRVDGVTVGWADRASCDRGDLRPDSAAKEDGLESLEGGRYAG